ncbi:MAG: methyltransferase domain-containing protein [Dysosmobacter sp.]
MAKLVQKSGYIKSEKAGGYMKYIATREGVEKLTGNGPVTKGQRELIQKLLHDFPDAVELFEYEDYRKTPTLGTASAFITMALDANLHEINSESGYLSYIATRPRVERRGTHGLFSSAAAVDLDAAMSELEAHESFDAVVISNALHVMPHPEKALAEAWRVLKPGGWLFAPTFVWGKSRSARLRLWFMGLSGFRVYHVWTAGELMAYLSECGYSIVRHPLLGSSLAPLCCLMARKIPDERTAARQTTVRSAQLDHTKVKEE